MDLRTVTYLMVLASVHTALATEPMASFHQLFQRMPQLQLSAAASRVVVNFTDLEECANQCVRQSDFDCRSFDVDNKHRMCRLYNTTHDEGKAFLTESAYTDHYRTAFENLFNKLPNHVITVKHRRKIPDVSAEQCARRCVFEQSFRCAGFDYEPAYANCWLTDLTVSESDGVKFHPGGDYYERDFGGALSSFVSYGAGSLPYVDDRPIYTKTMFGLDLGACAQVCLSQTTFDCASFDYSFGDQSCHMSRYIASNVGGLDNDNMPTYRVMHYEKKGTNLQRFFPTPYSIVPGENDRTLDKVTPERCAQACLEETSFVCRSFDYEIKDGSCMLSKKTGSDVGKLYNQGQVQVHHFEVKPSLDCGGQIIDSQGDFASPGWPRNYSHHLNCTWTVQVPEHKVIMFTFTHFDLGMKSQNPCSPAHDRLRITEVTPEREVRFCASPPMTTYISQTNVVSFNFLTNGHSDAQGFKVMFKGDWPCRAVLRSDRGELASPNWPEQYSPGMNCAWTIQAPENANITLKFTTIDLDGQSYGTCTDQHDYIEVYDGPSASAPRLARYCKHEVPAPILSTSNQLLVTFTTDSYVQRTGFHASYDFVMPATTAPPTTTTTTTTPSPDGRYEGNDALSAKFAEPRLTRDQPDFNMTGDVNYGMSGGEFVQPSPTQRDTQAAEGLSTDTYITILWIVLVSLLLMTTVLSLVLVAVCRHNRNRLEKKRNNEIYTGTREENASLYERELPRPKLFDDDIESFRGFSTDADISFANPLYRSGRNFPGRQSEVTLASEVMSDSGCSSSTTNSAGADSTTLLTSPC